MGEDIPTNYAGHENLRFTQELNINDPDVVEGIPVYRVLNTQGVIINEDHDPKVSNHNGVLILANHTPQFFVNTF